MASPRFRRCDLVLTARRRSATGHAAPEVRRRDSTRRSPMTTPLVTYTADGRVGIVTLNRPQKLNASPPELRRLPGERFHEADRDPTTSVAVFRAAGRSFGAAYDSGPRRA